MNSEAIPLLLSIPAVGAIVTAFLPKGGLPRIWALLVSLATAAVALWMVSGFNFNQSAAQFLFHPTEGSAFYLPVLNASLSFGVTSIGLWLVLLTVLLMPLAILSSYESIKDREKEYYAWMLGLMTAMLGVFVAYDVLLFYVFFELTLIPMFFIIGVWGGPDRRKAAVKFFLFTFAGSVFTLAAVTYLGLRAGTFDLGQVIHFAQSSLTQTERWWVLLGLLAGFAVKVPLFPVHTWLPLAHTEAPTAGSVILAGVLLKLGTFGLLQVALPIGMIYDGGVAFPGLIKFIGGLCVIGIIYGALVAWVQQDIKKLVAYSSVSHLGFCVLGLVALNDIGMQGSVLYMINHGLSTGALFLCIGMIYDRYHTRDINQLSGLAKIMPKLAFFFILFTMSSIGLPGLNGFWSEFLTILGAFTSPNLGIPFGALAATGVVLGAVYMLHMAARVIWGPLKVPGHAEHGDTSTPGHEPVHHDSGGHGAKNDIGTREIAILVPLAIAVIVLGVVPSRLTKTLLGPVQELRMTSAEKVARNAAQPEAVAVTMTKAE
ncbi:NADH-quinone oxidoreductase subunit M [soil metagenome]